jgi:hypothetical protein
MSHAITSSGWIGWFARLLPSWRQKVAPHRMVAPAEAAKTGQVTGLDASGLPAGPLIYWVYKGANALPWIGD